MFEHHHFQGRSWDAWPKSIHTWLGWNNDCFSSIQLRQFDGVMFHEHHNFEGAAMWVGCGGSGPVVCTLPAIDQWWNDHVTSVLIGGCVRLTLHEQANHQGRRWTVGGEVHIDNLSAFGWNDVVSSITIERFCSV